MKILEINKFFYLKGGSERYFFDLSKILEEKGHKVIHFSMEENCNYPSQYNRYFIKKVGFDKFSFKNIIKFFYNYDATRRLKELIKDEKPDIAHLHNIAHQISPAIIWTLKKYNIPIVQTLHDYKLICPNYKLFNKKGVCYKCKGKKYYNCFLNKCIKNSRVKSFIAMFEAYIHNKILRTYDKIDLFIAPTQFVKDITLEFGIGEERIMVLNYFLSDEFLNASLELTLQRRKEKKDDYLLFYGRLSEEKGIDILFDIIKKDDNIKLKLIGDGLERENIKFKINKQKLKHRIELLGAKYGNELWEIIKNAKAVIIPSVWPEILGYVLIESMAMEKVVIASRIGGIEEFVQDGVNGFLFEPRDSDSLIEKINSLDKFDLYKIGRKARQRVLKLNAQDHYRKINQIYAKFI